jgi:hypothetical protein
MKLFLKFSMYDDPKAGRVIVHAINQWIYGRLRMLTQFQKYEVGKLESSETKLYFGPEIWTYVGENGGLCRPRSYIRLQSIILLMSMENYNVMGHSKGRNMYARMKLV